MPIAITQIDRNPTFQQEPEQFEVLKQQNNSIKYEQTEQINNQIREAIESFRKQKPAEIAIDSFEIPKHFIKMVARGISNSAFLLGEGGIGKSYLTINIIKEEVGNDFVYVNGVVTPLSLYKLLYENKDKLIVLDDVFGLFESDRAVSLLKSALWSVKNRRIIHYHSTSRYAGTVVLLFLAASAMDGDFSALIVTTCPSFIRKEERSEILPSTRTCR